ncbi:MAG: sigma-70 family RNA polymerase sigma factor [Anaerolineales bacterium]|nr:sigma-70 family RNA polymerase sigma factor [Anaerolineales bacterium]
MQSGEMEWVRRAQAGDKDAFGILVQEYQGFVYNLALRTVSNPQDAEDIAQETFLRAWKAMPRFQFKSKISTWLYRITMNLCYNRLPGLKREIMAEDDQFLESIPDEYFPNPSHDVEIEELRTLLHQQIEQMPPGYRMVVMLRFQQELSYDEVSEIADIPLGTVKTILFRARNQLREVVRYYHEEPVWNL